MDKLSLPFNSAKLLKSLFEPEGKETTMTMRYAEVVEPHRIEIRETEIPEPGDAELLVRVRVCGVDWPTFRHVMEGNGVEYPANGSNNLGLAHEGSGKVVAVGRDVAGFKVGDRVSYLGAGFQEYAVINRAYCGRIPDGVDYLDLLGEPMAVMYHSARKLPSDLDSIAVFGAGYMGLGLIHMLSRMGQKRIIVVEIDPDRLKTAEELGGSVFVNAGEQDAAVEATGADSVLQQIGYTVRPNGMILVHGWFSGQRQLNLEQWHAKDLTVAFSHPAPHEIYCGLIETVGKMVAEGVFHLRPLITHQLPLGRNCSVPYCVFKSFYF